jgi:hypothetical protein
MKCEMRDPIVHATATTLRVAELQSGASQESEGEER